MKRALAFVVWLALSLPMLVVVRNIARSEFPEYSWLAMGAAFAVVIYVLLSIPGWFPRSSRNENENQIDNS
jgi:hypothetical protein